MSKSSEILGRNFSNNLALRDAIEAFLEADNTHFIACATEDESIRNGDDAFTQKHNSARCDAAAKAVCKKLDRVISIPSNELVDIVRKMRLWKYISGIEAISHSDLNPSERLITSIAEELEAVSEAQ